MLFNSFAFLLAFLPAALLAHWLVSRFRPSLRLPLLLVLSVAFYGYWDWRFVPLLAASILVNWLVAESFAKTRRKGLIALAIAANLLVLAVFKYLDFFAGLASLVPGAAVPTFDIALPLGISFFTFHHVMYLTDLRAGRAPRYDLVRYGLYIAFFPQVLAGPLVRWSEIMHQFDEQPYERSDAEERIARGLMLLVLGLAKKVFLGDPLAEYVNPAFEAAAPDAPSPWRRPGRRRWDSRSRSTSTSPAIPTWPSGWPCCSGSCFRRTSTRPTAPFRCGISGGGGT